MVRQVPDSRFGMRPFYQPTDLDRLCEKILVEFFRPTHGAIPTPIPTDDLTRLIERDTSDFDPGADLSGYGPDVEGVTEFAPGRKPRVRIAAGLAYDERRHNRYRTTLTHEYGHVHLHAYLYEIAYSTGSLIGSKSPQVQVCKRDTMFSATKTDWMEWQAGYVCGALLMPLSTMRQCVGTYQEASNLFGPVSRNTEHARALIDVVRKLFQVSEEAARVRLAVLNFIGDQTHERSLFD